MIDDYGNTLLDLCKRIEGGILVFFQTYEYMYRCTKKWKADGIIEKIEKQS